MRTFWPVSAVVGEGMMQVSEQLAASSKCRVITQNQDDLRASLQKFNRGSDVLFSPVFALSNSSSNFVMRILDLLWFALSVMLILMLRRPRVVYVATDPPVLVPIVVCFYSRFFGARYVYHVQDIHPEASRIVFPQLRSRLGFLYRTLLWFDSVVLRNATEIITLTQEMSRSLHLREGCHDLPITFINNPATQLPLETPAVAYDYSFVGNAGRLQLMPLLVAAIRQYLEQGGVGRFAFAGAGVMSKSLSMLEQDYPENVVYFGKVDVEQATLITLSSKWAMLPIDDEVCQYAFPSKASTYVVAGRPILAICSLDSSVGKWVDEYRLGVVVDPELSALVSFFHNQAQSSLSPDNLFGEFNPSRDELQDLLSTKNFVVSILSLFERVESLQ
jgi:hypothetical protein